MQESAQIKHLMELAHDKSEAGRRTLVENIADLFLTPEGRLNDHERALMSDILCKLIETIEASVRAHLAESLATIDEVPPDLINLLARDDIEIARPILESSQVLKDPDLIEIVRRRTKEHRVSIAMRESVSADVSDALIQYGDHDVIETLLHNQDAELSERAMEYLVTESRRVDRFQEPLVQYHDLPPELAHRMFWWVSAALRRYILLNYKADELALDEALESSARNLMVEHNAAEGVNSRAQRLVHRLLQSGDLSPAFLIQSLRQNRLPVFVAGVAELAAISNRIVWRIFTDEGGESLAVLCKAIGIERADFTTIFLLVDQANTKRAPLKPGILKANLGLYDKIDSESAKAVLRYWQRDPEYSTAIRDVGET